MSTRTDQRRRTVRGGLVVAIAMVVMNVSTYLFNIIAAPLLGPREYGAVAAIIGVLTVVNVIALGLQATAARRVAAQPESTAAIEREMRRITIQASLVVGVGCLLLAPVLNAALRLDSLLVAILIAVASATLTLVGGVSGLLQGESRWLALSAVYLGFGVGRLAAGAVCMFLSPTVAGATLGITIGAFAPVIVGAVALRRRERVRQDPSIEHPEVTRVLREVISSSHALLAFLCLSNVDMVIARVTMTEHQSGLYAAGLIITKAVLFLPQFVIVVLFPQMSRQAQRARTPWAGLATIGAMGVIAVGATAALSTVVLPTGNSVMVQFIGGEAYAEVGPRLWAWALLGLVLSMLQLLIYGVLATQNTAAISVVWTGLAVVVTCAPFLVGPSTLITVVTFVDLVLLGVLLTISVIVSTTSVGRLVPTATGADGDIERNGE